MEKYDVKSRSYKRQKFSGNYIFFIAPALVLLIFLILFAIKGIAPFGQYVYLPSDMYHQYCPFLSELWYKLRSGGSLLYSWDVGLGTNFTSLFAYYLSSPLNFLIGLFPHSMIAPLMNAFIIIKMMCASFFFTLYLSKHYNDKHILICVWSCFYAMSGYIAAYAWNIMWLDVVAVFPLVILGIEILVKKKRPFLFIISLGLSVIFNYYISIMVVMGASIYFLLIVFLGGYLEKKRHIPLVIGIYIGSCLIAAGLSACLLLPEVYSFTQSASSGSTFPTTLKAYHTFLQMIARHMTFSPSYTWLEHFPNIYCSVFIIPLIPLFFMSKKIRAQRKIIFGILTGIFLFSFMFNIPEYIWHGFHFPNCLPARQSFIYIFFLLTFSYEVIKSRGRLTLAGILISAELSAAYLVIMYIMFNGEKTVADSDTFSYSLIHILWNAAFIAAYILLLFFARRPKLFNTYFVTSALGALMLLECALHFNDTSLSLVNYTDYRKNDEAFATAIQEAAKDEEELFYRIDQKDARTANDGAWYGYRSVNTFSSTSPSGVSVLYRQMGSKAAMNSYQRLGGTHFTDSLLGDKYMIIKDEVPADSPLQDIVYTTDRFCVIKNKYTLPLGFMLPFTAADTHTDKSSFIRDSLYFQNMLFEDATGIPNVIDLEDKFEEDKLYTHAVRSSGHLYIVCHADVPESISVAINEDEAKEFKDLKSHNHVIDAGFVNEGDIITLSSEDNFTCKCYVLNTEKFIRGITTLQETGLKLSTVTDTYLKGAFTCMTDGAYTFTIPYDDGWSVYVDGKPREISKSLDAFLRVDVEAGEHEVELRFFPKYLREGIIVSLVSLGILCILIIIYKRRQRNIKE